jgi:hypothetical protein
MCVCITSNRYVASKLDVFQTIFEKIFTGGVGLATPQRHSESEREGRKGEESRRPEKKVERRLRDGVESRKARPETKEE